MRGSFIVVVIRRLMTSRKMSASLTGCFSDGFENWSCNFMTVYLHEWLMMIINSRGVKPSGNLTSDISLAFLLVVCPLPNFSMALQSQVHNSDQLLVVFLFPAFAQMLFTNYFNGLWSWISLTVILLTSLFASHTHWFIFLFIRSELNKTATAFKV